MAKDHIILNDKTMNSMIHTIQELCLEGLTTDDGHHKQWYLERILETTCIDMKQVRERFEWEKGIAP